MLAVIDAIEAHGLAYDAGYLPAGPRMTHCSLTSLFMTVRYRRTSAKGTTGTCTTKRRDLRRHGGVPRAPSEGRSASRQGDPGPWQDLARSRERCLTTSFVIDEALTLIGRRAGNRFAATVGRRLYDSRVLEIHDPGRDEQVGALGTLDRYADRRVSFTERVSFGVMRARRIERVLGFDEDFAIAGFLLVPGAVATD